MVAKLEPPSGMQSWEQLTLFQPEGVTVEMVLHVSDRGRFLDGGVRVLDMFSGDTYATEALHWPPSETGIAEAVARYLAAVQYWAGVVWCRPGVPGGGETG